MSDVFILGVGCTPFGRHHDSGIRTLAADAIAAAAADADVGLDAIGAAFFANSTQGHFDGQHALRGPVALRHAGFRNGFVTSVENACAGGLTAFTLAVQAIRSGACDVAIAVGAEKLVHPDKAKSFAAFESGVDLGEPEALAAGLAALAGQHGCDAGSRQRSRMMDIYAALAAFHMRSYGTTPAQFAQVAAKNRRVGALNPLAAIQRAVTVDEVLAADAVVGPLTVPMCAPLTDGAAAVVLVSERVAASRRRGAVRVRAARVQTGEARPADHLERHVSRLTALQAYEDAALGPHDIDLAEVHDATALGEILQSELLGFCEHGGGGALVSSGETSLGGGRPINLSGGLESKGHPLGATGLSQICEATWQLRGVAGLRQTEKARIALIENGGGFLTVEEAVCGVAILEAPPR
jgi:acetyl-CoA acyltransferase